MAHRMSLWFRTLDRMDQVMVELSIGVADKACSSASTRVMALVVDRLNKLPRTVFIASRKKRASLSSPSLVRQLKDGTTRVHV
jgi:hypothetical protein